MSEVSTRAFHVFFPALETKRIPLERIVTGTTLSATKLRDRTARMTWSEACQLLHNLRPHFDDAELVELGATVFRPRAARAAFAVARLLMTPMGLYRWLNTPKKGAGNQIFACITPTFRELSDRECELELVLPPGYEVAWEFFVLTRGSLAEVPRLFGHPPATVAVERLPNGARFRIAIPPHVPAIARVRRAITWPFAARAAARELKASNEELVDRYEQLAKTTAELEEYKTGLEQMVDERTRELREARDELAATVVQLRDAQEVRQRFFANISHEIRTPLSLILLAAADVDARAGAALDDRARANLGAVGDSARKLVRLVDELLLLAAAQESKLVLRREPTDLAALVRRLEVAWRLAAEAAGLSLVARAPDALVADVDPVALERVASNLISNAVKYTPRGGYVEIEIGDVADGIVLCVRDDGPGIADELAQRLFGRFERALGETRRKQGTGLGLFLVKQLVDAHGGTVAALARAPRGSELRVVLPAALAIRGTAATTPFGRRAFALAPEAPEAAPRTLHFVPPRLSAGTILLAEDDVALAEQVARLLADRYTVVVAHDGVRALELAKQHHPQLLVTDVDMPEMDGIELARRFRDAVGDRLAPIVMLSAVVDLRARVAGLEAGAIDYITKPFDPLELSARVDAQFRTRDLAMRLHRAEQLSALGILTSGLAHELRNPANGIVNAIAPLCELLPPEVTRPGTATRELLDVLASCGDQVGFLARQLLGFRSGGEIELRPAAVGELVERALALAQRALSGVDLRSSVEMARTVSCAPPLLVQVLTNLVENAAYAAGQGGWVSIATEARDGHIAIEVGDSGPGVPVELRERVFEPFFTTKPEGSGVGLGLAVARAIVQRHHGVLEVRERRGRCVFVVELPDLQAAQVANAV